MIQEEIISFLKSKVDNGTVKIHFTDGETMEAIIRFVSDSEADVTCEIVSSDKADKYASYGSNLITTPFTDIETVSD